MAGYVIRHRVHSPSPWKSHRIYSLCMDDSLEWVRWVERIVLGQTDPRKKLCQDEQLGLASKLEESLKSGKLLGLEQGWRTHKDADNREKVCRYVAYHIGYSRRPDDRNNNRVTLSKNVEKFAVGSTSLKKPKSDEVIENKITWLNRALIHGKIVGHELNFTICCRKEGERHLSSLVYHVDFKNKSS